MPTVVYTLEHFKHDVNDNYNLGLPLRRHIDTAESLQYQPHQPPSGLEHATLISVSSIVMKSATYVFFLELRKIEQAVNGNSVYAS